MKWYIDYAGTLTFSLSIYSHALLKLAKNTRQKISLDMTLKPQILRFFKFAANLRNLNLHSPIQ
jgi:hypothetical protein